MTRVECSQCGARLHGPSAIVLRTLSDSQWECYCNSRCVDAARKGSGGSPPLVSVAGAWAQILRATSIRLGNDTSDLDSLLDRLEVSYRDDPGDREHGHARKILGAGLELRDRVGARVAASLLHVTLPSAMTILDAGIATPHASASSRWLE